ncbi:MATE family efflux transporter [Parasphingopyxis marina]|uniref:Multidrug-efflux transporter n=1 Tax=Parasphingopyxis marina TaxID=2761622 RepID=A0A842HUG7_9SPHN|nr:MATE family efflux transporter [Parasphingopyxis marina]MBC2776575.1 MATE family efflux transporter [Parasphingopyxis marina]
MDSNPAPEGLARRRTGIRVEIRATLALAWPLVLGNLAQASIHTTEVLILGRYDVDALAAAALGVNLYFAFAIFAMGLVTAASPLIAAEYGRRWNSVRDVRRTVRQALWASLAICLPCWLILWNSESLLLLLGQEPALSRDAAHFIRIAMWGLFPFLVYIVLRYYVTALERPIWGLLVTGVGVVFNALACWALVFGGLGLPELGLTGAGIANVLANSVLALGMIAVVYGVRRFRRYKLLGHFWRADWPRLAAIVKLGVPIAVTLGMEITVFNAAVFLMGLIGRDSLAAHAIAIQVASLAFMLPLGLSQAATVRVGIFHGRKDAEGVARAGRVALGLGLGAAFFLSSTMVLFPNQLIGLFIDPADPAMANVFALALSFLFVAAIFQLVDGAQAVGAGVLRGVQDTRWPMLFAAFGYWVVGLGVAVWLGFPMGLQGVGIWIGLAFGLAVVAVLMVGRWLMRARIGLIDYQRA